MSEENTTDTESETPEISPIEDFINAVTAKDYVSASKDFENMMMSKVDDALGQEKINIASQVFNDEEPNGDESEEDLEDSDEEESKDNDEEDLEDSNEEESEEEPTS
ncbi:MAG: hypothetical protein CBE14_002790 [Rickettsiales bacterium TMED254]|nr:MAG: hypothetical protein CBE14_002790 [Rickettsiales bacterium TMED254]|tara:strand:- start:158 stop:478 length:321 start_codon:yes stop_codon:yes gene_type:complete